MDEDGEEDETTRCAVQGTRTITGTDKMQHEGGQVSLKGKSFLETEH